METGSVKRPAIIVAFAALFPRERLVNDAVLMMERVAKERPNDFVEVMALSQAISNNRFKGKLIPIQEMAVIVRNVLSERDAMRNGIQPKEWWSKI